MANFDWCYVSLPLKCLGKPRGFPLALPWQMILFRIFCFFFWLWGIRMIWDHKSVFGFSKKKAPVSHWKPNQTLRLRNFLAIMSDENPIFVKKMSVCGWLPARWAPLPSHVSKSPTSDCRCQFIQEKLRFSNFYVHCSMKTNQKVTSQLKKAYWWLSD